MARWTSEAIRALREDLSPIETDAGSLPWAQKAPWTVRSHVTTERRMRVRGGPRDRVVRIDLHGLDKALAERACQLIRASLESPESRLAWARVVVGRGKHSAGGRRVVAAVAEQVLGDVSEPLRITSSTREAEEGHLDVVHRGRWRRRPRGTW